ncbi:MAG: hypothetical protein LBU99_02660 [Spirochaetaceae bacterium]|jgi:hypothetical protein|nr:hypothetical protein [Spirochaetaceae bacterium]
MINYEVEKPELSRRFDVEDIRALRVWGAERWKDASFEEVKCDIAELSKPISDKIGYVFDEEKKCYIHYPNR